MRLVQMVSVFLIGGFFGIFNAGINLEGGANVEKNMIELNWQDDSVDNVYRVFKKTNDIGEFQSIGFFDIGSNEKITVLNIYPEDEEGRVYKVVEFETYDGEKLSLPESASLKRWMEEPTKEFPKGYGMGKVEVVPISQKEFNKNPKAHMQDEAGKWKYETVVHGFADNNGRKEYNKAGLDIIREFVEEGRGYLVGHDTILSGRETSTNSLRDLFNIKLNFDDGVDVTSVEGEKIKASKKGSLLNYPHKIDITPENKELLSISKAHSTGQVAYGDIWLSFYGERGETDSGGKGSSNFFLTSTDNTAMIQSGHYIKPAVYNGNGEITSDEKKVIANTLMYLSQISTKKTLNDYSGQDVQSPNSINNFKYNAKSNGLIDFYFDECQDRSTKYSYYVEGTSKNGNKINSNTINVVMEAGIKGYSYVIDTNPSTIPDDTVDIVESKGKDRFGLESKDVYIHIKAIDNVNNVSQVMHEKIFITEVGDKDEPILKAKSVPNENMIRLDWSVSDYTNKIFKVFQKSELANEFQSIGNVNFDDSNKIKVLNIYPEDQQGYEYKTINFSTYDGESMSLPESASLKKWMEEPTQDFPKGYGMGKIEVIPISQTEFNKNPKQYMKDSSGEWKYDAVAHGFADINGYKSYSEDGLDIIREFVNSGYGYLIGHDTILSDFETPANDLRDLFGIKLNFDEGVNVSSLEGNELKIAKKGVLLSYPHTLDNMVDTLKVSKSHSTGQVSYGDIWLKFDAEGEQTDANGQGTNNFFLSSNNNTAMIQSGHYIRPVGHGFGDSIGITGDEKKIIANTLLYLSQLSSDNFLNDYSGQDCKSPSAVKNVSYSASKDGLDFSFDEATDYGTEYKYYVESYDKHSNEKERSNTVSQAITTGIKGYSFEVNADANTIPNDEIDTVSGKANNIELRGSKGLYLHIKSIDNAGNSSETIHIELDIKEDIYVEPILNIVSPVDKDSYDVGEFCLVNWTIKNGWNLEKDLKLNIVDISTSKKQIENVSGTSYKLMDLQEGEYEIYLTGIGKRGETIKSNSVGIKVSLDLEIQIIKPIENQLFVAKEVVDLVWKVSGGSSDRLRSFDIVLTNSKNNNSMRYRIPFASSKNYSLGSLGNGEYVVSVIGNLEGGKCIKSEEVSFRVGQHADNKGKFYTKKIELNTYINYIKIDNIVQLPIGTDFNVRVYYSKNGEFVDIKKSDFGEIIKLPKSSKELTLEIGMESKNLNLTPYIDKLEIWAN